MENKRRAQSVGHSINLTNSSNRSIDMNKPLMIKLHKDDQSHGLAIFKKGKGHTLHLVRMPKSIKFTVIAEQK